MSILTTAALEGLRHKELRAFSVQYHPEHAPGPHDAEYLFGRFIDLMETSQGGPWSFFRKLRPRIPVSCHAQTYQTIPQNLIIGPRVPHSFNPGQGPWGSYELIPGAPRRGQGPLQRGSSGILAGAMSLISKLRLPSLTAKSDDTGSPEKNLGLLGTVVDTLILFGRPRT